MNSFDNTNSDIAFNLTKGNTSDIIYVRPSILNGATLDCNWTCSSTVTDDAGNIVVDEFSVTDKSADNTEFKAFLTPSQTLQLSTNNSEYVWSIQLRNPVLSPPIVSDLNFSIGVSS